MIGILGGTFDPVHYGHLRPADEVRKRLALDEVRVIPAAYPPHRATPVASARDRLRMVELAVREFPGFVADDREIRQGRPSYTVTTLESLRADVGARPLCLLLGADSFRGLETWHQWQRLPELAHLVVMHRPGWSMPQDADLPVWVRGRIRTDRADLARGSAGGVLSVAVTPQDISATDIRARIARGESAAAYLPAAVWTYIRDHHLYRPFEAIHAQTH